MLDADQHPKFFMASKWQHAAITPEQQLELSVGLPQGLKEASGDHSFSPSDLAIGKTIALPANPRGEGGPAGPTFSPVQNRTSNLSCAPRPTLPSAPLSSRDQQAPAHESCRHCTWGSNFMVPRGSRASVARQPRRIDWTQVNPKKVGEPAAPASACIRTAAKPLYSSNLSAGCESALVRRILCGGMGCRWRCRGMESPAAPPPPAT